MWISVKEAAAKLGCSPRHVARMCQAGMLKHINIGTAKKQVLRIDSELEVNEKTTAPLESISRAAMPLSDMFRGRRSVSK